MSLSPWQTAVLAVATWLLMHLHNNFEPSDTIFPHSSMANTTATTEAYYSENYYQARALFREHARAADAELHTLPFEHLAKWDLTVDIAVVKGARDRVLVHLSGTHGVEGFAGSAIQSAVLAQLATGHKATADRSNSPTLVFIHAVNPFGFAMLRRFNEHNVDLNRNWLSEAQFADFTTRDPNTHGYMDLYSLFNPTTDSANWNNWFWPRVLVDFATKGFNAIKQAVITGNYNMPTTIFYGGDRLQPTLVAIKSFLATHIDWAGITQLAVLDIHTGLGKSGEDTVMIMPSSTQGVTERLFPHEFKANRVAALHDSTNPVTQGYEDVAGYVAEGIATLLPSSATCEVLALVQEFGTVPGVFVLKATAQENAFYHHAPTQRLPYAERIRDVFYTHRSASWKNSVLARGTEVFASLTTHLSSTSPSS